MKKDITVILLLLGRSECQSNQLKRAIDQLQELSKKAEIIIAADGPKWNAIPLIHMVSTMEGCKQCSCRTDNSLPSKVINTAIPYVNTDYIQLALLNDPFAERFYAFQNAIDAFRVESSTDQSINALPAFWMNSTSAEYSESPFITQLTYDRMQNNERCFGMGMLCIPMWVIRKLGMLDESPLLQEEIERWLALAVMKWANVRQAGTEDKAYPSLYEYPLKHHLSRERELARRYAIYSHGIAVSKRTNEQCARDFSKDLGIEDAETYAKVTGIINVEKTRFSTRYRILIIGGAFEYHHNQICFYNYIESLYGQGFATFNCAYEYEIPSIRALKYNLVIFTRARSENALKMMHFCKSNGIPTLYMIDDNWLSIATDHPEQGSMFMAGKPDYDHFIEALGLCKAVWLFNDVLMKDVLPYTNCVKQFEISVNPDLFYAATPRQRKDDEIYIGYSGSMRYDDSAFRALARYARRHKTVTVVLLGTLSPEQEALFSNLKCKRIGFQNYGQYAKSLAELQPDLLLAPLQDTHTSRSKCYNKYIESAVVGAACIFSPIPPYTNVVIDGKNGFFVEEETEDGWYHKLEAVLSDLPTLRKIQCNAKRETLELHSVKVVREKFAAKIQNMIEEEEPIDD